MPSKVYYIQTKKSEQAESFLKKLDMLIAESGVLKFIAEDDFVGIKLHFGEAGNATHINHEWVRRIVQHIERITDNAFLTDSNVLYKNSSRSNAVDHLKIAHEHGFDLEDMGAPIVIADGLTGKNYTEISLAGKHFSKVKIACDIASCDSLLVLSHVTGHFQMGLGGALKNLGMGCASRRGKYEQHSGVVPAIFADSCVGCGHCVSSCPASCISIKKGRVAISKESCIGCGECVIACKTKALDIKWSETLENLQEKMVEYACGAVKAVNGRVGYINFVVNITKDCDCMSKDGACIMEDVGILASRDPVSIDKASVDIMNERSGMDILTYCNPQTRWPIQLKYASEIGLGNLEYKLEKVAYD